jgi:hypothetical protein
VTAMLLSVSMDTLGSSCKWLMQRSSLCVCPLSLGTMASGSNPCYSICWSLLPFSGWIVVLCPYKAHSAHPASECVGCVSLWLLWLMLCRTRCTRICLCPLRSCAVWQFSQQFPSNVLAVPYCFPLTGSPQTKHGGTGSRLMSWLLGRHQKTFFRTSHESNLDSLKL